MNIMSIKKDNVIKVATKLFAEKGFENTSIANICSVANVSKGLVYHHFESKESILIAIFTQTTDQMIEMNMETKKLIAPNIQLQQLIETIFTQLHQNKHLYQFNLNIMFQPSTKKILSEQIERRANILFNSVKNIFDQISQERSTMLTYIFIAEIDGIALNYLSVFNKYPIEMIKQELLNKYKNIK
ncbi:DNA-binding transcriptional regulator, AcrR family [Tenacibaculum sp. MAR_2010_89]|nr:DNA-binding transcriptional regulator, AcrR family [Tenacibaculum sp. MAR_2010_89]